MHLHNHMNFITVWKLTDFALLVNQTVTLHPGRPDADHFMMYEYYDLGGEA